MKPSLLERFEAKYIPEPNSGCWLWVGGVRPSHSGDRPTIRDHGQKVAARVSWQLHKGPIPRGVLVLHRCDIPLCVNPDHLFLGTNTDNMRDMVRKGRNKALWGLTNGGGKLTDREVGELRQLRGFISQKKLAKLYGVHHTHISHIQLGRKRSLSGG